MGLAALANGSMYAFDGAGGQSPTQYERWLNATEPYEVPFVSGFEPWGIVYRSAGGQSVSVARVRVNGRGRSCPRFFTFVRIGARG